MSRPDKLVSFTRFVTQNQGAVRSYLRAVGVRPDAVDDLAQEAFVIAYRKLDSFEEDRDWGKWIRGIARNVMLNERQRVARRTRIMDERLCDHLLLEAEMDDASVYNEDQRRALQECLGELPERSRNLIARRYGDGWTSNYLADQFEMTATAVRLALMRIRRQLRTCVRMRCEGA
jgi:RNA polymerase sigma-70 factor (ECF subfamily)